MAVARGASESRKLQKIKGGSFTISLPKRWVESQGLRGGDRIELLEEEDGALRLYPPAPAPGTPEEVSLALEEFPDLRTLEYCIGTYYMQGSNRITVASKDIIPAEHKKRLKLLRMELTGVEIIEDASNRLVFQVLVDPSLFSLESLITRTSSFAIQLHEDAVRSLVEGQPKLAAEVLERSTEALRRYRVMIRQISLASQSSTIAKQIGAGSCRECVTFALAARDLSRIMYHASYVARLVLDLEGKKIDSDLIRPIRELSDIAGEMQANAVQAFMSGDIRLATETIGRMTSAREKEKQFLTKLIEKVRHIDTVLTLSTIARHLRRIAGYSVAISDDAMNRVLTPARARCFEKKR